jgi:hypothetical protein
MNPPPATLTEHSARCPTCKTWFDRSEWRGADRCAVCIAAVKAKQAKRRRCGFPTADGSPCQIVLRGSNQACQVHLKLCRFPTARGPCRNRRPCAKHGIGYLGKGMRKAMSEKQRMLAARRQLAKDMRRRWEVGPFPVAGDVTVRRPDGTEVVMPPERGGDGPAKPTRRPRRHRRVGPRGAKR